MKRLVLLTILLCGVVSMVFAQTASTTTNATKPKLGVALETGIPVGDAEDVYAVGLGGSAKLEIPISQPFAATVTAGYMSMLVKDELEDALGENREFIPIKAGAKYYFSKNFFGEGELGASISTEEGEDVAFAYAPGIGFSFPVSDRTAIDAGVRYEGWTREQSSTILNGNNLDQVGFRVVLKF